MNITSPVVFSVPTSGGKTSQAVEPSRRPASNLCRRPRQPGRRVIGGVSNNARGQGWTVERWSSVRICCLTHFCVARQKQLAEADAQDAVQGFFESLLRRETFTTADETVGKLRQLLLRAFDNFCGQQWEKSQRQKRGGGAEHIEFTEMTDAERRYLKSCESIANPEALYNRAWASSVMERSLQALRDDYEGCGWLERYELLMPVLMQQDDEPSLTQLAVSSGTTAGALRVTLHRMRGHYRSMIKRELALTLDTDDPKLLREEMVELLKAFA